MSRSAFHRAKHAKCRCADCLRLSAASHRDARHTPMPLRDGDYTTTRELREEQQTDDALRAYALAQCDAVARWRSGATMPRFVATPSMTRERLVPLMRKALGLLPEGGAA